MRDDAVFGVWLSLAWRGGRDAKHALREAFGSARAVFEAGFDRLFVEAPDGAVSIAPVREGGCALCPDVPGFYRVRALRGDERSDPVEFCVTDLRFETDRESYAPGEAIKLRARNSAGDPIVAWQFNKCASDRGCGGGFFTEPPSGRGIELVCPEVRERVELYLMARNAYGVYTSDRIVVNRDAE